MYSRAPRSISVWGAIPRNEPRLRVRARGEGLNAPRPSRPVEREREREIDHQHGDFRDQELGCAHCVGRGGYDSHSSEPLASKQEGVTLLPIALPKEKRAARKKESSLLEQITQQKPWS